MVGVAMLEEESWKGSGAGRGVVGLCDSSRGFERLFGECFHCCVSGVMYSGCLVRIDVQLRAKAVLCIPMPSRIEFTSEPPRVIFYLTS